MRTFLVKVENDKRSRSLYYIVKTSARKITTKMYEKDKSKIAELDHWSDKSETKAIVDNLIRDTLWAELPESYDEISITTYRKEIYEYIYLRYKTAA